ncbi:MAG: MFS transporter [Desulfobacteraceae bacterium]|nr:MFS transporter [Desulfobacteraceae bacterium]
MTPEKRAVWGWAIYDWANSAFATTVMAGFFPIFFKQYWSHGTDVNLSTAQLGFGNALAGLIVALMAPLLGAIADRGEARKKLLIWFAYMGVLASAGLFFVAKGQWPLAIFVYILGVIGFSGANIFYDALLPGIAGEGRVDRVSSLGFSLGYLGGGLLFLVNVLMTLMPQRFGLIDSAAAVRLSFLTVALWWGAFTLITILWVPEPSAGPVKQGPSALRAGWRQLADTFRRARHLKTVSLFLLAYWFYIDGVDTIIRMAVDYGMSLGFEANDLIVALLLVQFVGFPAALVFGRLGERWGVRRAIYLGIGIYIGITLWGTLMRQRHEFFVLAGVIGLVQGGIQALSRSYYTRIIPKDKAAEFFGFYNMLGKFATIMGPALMGIVGLTVRRLMMPPNPSPEQIQAVGQLATRLSLGSVVVLFLVGLVLFSRVDETCGRIEAAHLAD